GQVRRSAGGRCAEGLALPGAALMRGPLEPTPLFFTILVVEDWHGTEAIARELWLTYARRWPEEARAVAWHCDQVASALLLGDAALRHERVTQLVTLLDPHHLVEACEDLTRHRGRQGRRALRAVEERILARMQAQGLWK